ncbi:TspO/MBR family protein [Sphingomonas sp. NFR15]|uniref:TspO/MBR family protein n=1 Tax=Sphingomonas sp. NFR15 TaxID=1566282 RepID=UPI000880B9CD|nr:TspO/MBR family protein [Sphingomonas sp. NFR15]SDA16889.1 TspO and MBR related proteins [Sphingomonas sp. NFR15]
MSEIASRQQLRLAFLRWAIVTVPLILLLGFTSARIAPAGSQNRWYAMLAKPAANPPDWVFPVAWTTLYILMGLALAMVIHARGSRLRAPAIALFAVQLLVNLIWSPVFFGMHLIGWALAIIVAMFVLALATTLLFGRVRRLAAWLMVPYLAWITFAGALLFQIDRLNPNAETIAPASASTQVISL